MDELLNDVVSAENQAGQGGAESERLVTPEDVMTISSLEQRTLNPDLFLYKELVKAHLGERAASVVGMLVALGRLSVRELEEKIDGMDTESIKTTLVSLTQLRCVKFLQETAISGKKTTYYYYNEEGIHLLLYSGLIIDEITSQMRVDDEHKQLVAQIVQNVISLGSLTVEDYLSSVTSESMKYTISSLFVQLCEMGYLIQISKLHYTPIEDLWQFLFDKHYNTIPRNSPLSDLKKRSQAKMNAKTDFAKILSKPNDLSQILTVDTKTSLRVVKSTVSLTINLDRFMKGRRSKQLTNLAKTRVGSITAQVYSIALRLTEQKSPCIIDPLTQTGLLQDLDEAKSFQEELELIEEKTPGLTFNAIDLAKHIPKELDLRGSLVTKKPSDNKKRSGSNSAQPPANKKLKTEDGFAIPALPAGILKSVPDSEEGEQGGEQEAEDDDELDADMENPHSASLINSHLKILSSSNFPFLNETKPGVYYVPYSKLMPTLKSSVYEYIIASTLGPSAMRLSRCIRDNKLVSEKIINSTALMKEKDIRSTLASLIRYNSVEIQEVPRTVDRSASRAVFLFRCKETHSCNFMKQNLEWNMANLLFKKERLKQENSTLLKKANRDDVKGKENELLLPSELNQLKMVNERELNVFARLSRLLSLWEVFQMA
ncbi:DNA-directed RNA polymerase III subunit C82 [Saccharomyces eubayanus]|uniref:DNA-directed RNA polymerase III subunit C82 n=1 Tax=Saccharomyces eubayanus TaxID=1080349 RepID=UPI0006C48D81|nr:RPC82-like protein [Saccharomyces eubayanus]KOG96471.1 RPC82-like protein [Saccharomyces eubayanus]